MVNLKRQAERRESKTHDLSGRMVTLLNPTSPASEAYRTLRTSLLYARVERPPKVIVVTSPGPREGKSTTCANLAVALSQTGKDTLLVDCDLRHPVVHRMFDIANFRGFGDILIGNHDLTEVLVEPLPMLKVLPAGPPAPNPAELVGSERCAEFLGQVRQDFDYVLIDTPPVTAVSDALTLATQGDGVLLVLDAQSTRKRNVAKAVRSLNSIGANILGTVMNNVKGVEVGYYSDYLDR